MLFFLACSGEPEDTGETGDVTDTDTTTDTGDTGAPVPYDADAGDCDVPLYDTSFVDVFEVYSGSADGELAMHGVRVVETQAEWEAILGLSWLDAEPVAVDFATHRLLIGAEWENSTCGLSLVSAQVIGNNFGGPHLEVVIHDSSGGCETVCDAIGGYAYVGAVPRTAGDFVTVCRYLTPGC